MSEDLTFKTFLVVEDEEDKRDFLTRFLLSKNILSKNIFEAETAREAISIIEDELPDMILLDIAIPFEREMLPDPSSCIDVIKNIQLSNQKNKNAIKTIIISAIVTDKSIQKLIEGHQEVFSYFDKTQISIDPDEFKRKLWKKIVSVLTQEPEEKKIDYYSLVKSELHELKKVNPNLWDKFEKDIIKEFERFGDKKVNEHTASKNIIRNAGELVEIVINLLENEPYEISSIKVTDDYFSIRDRLTILSGRKYVSKNQFACFGKLLISRKSCYYATQAYFLRNQLSHQNEDDPDNNKLFHISKATKEDASISIQLILPLIIDYINLKKKK